MSGEKKSKRKLGLVIGYLGTAYRGLQINREHAGLPTVEQVLEEAMYKAGLIRESNFGDLDKIGWSRSSRTDKGVHAARLLVCGKLLVNLDDFDELGLSQTVSETINAHLPIDIRVFSCAKVPGAFRPRESCSYREYEYWLPARYFSTSPPDSCPVHSVEESLEIFKEVVRSFEGTHSFHNFQGSRSKEMRKKKQVMRKRKAAEAEEDSQIDEEEEGKDESDTNFDSGNEEEILPPPTSLEQRMILKEMTGNMYSCTVDGPFVVNEEPLFRIFVRGQSFLYNQIRLMIGAAMAAANGILPRFAIQMALDSSYHVPIPVAPAQGLVLVNQNFARYANAVVMEQESLKDIIGEDITYNGTKRFQILMSNKMVEACSAFEKEMIRPEIARAWTEGNICQEWMDYVARFRLKDEFLAELKSKEPETVEQTEALRQAKYERDVRRRKFCLEKGQLGEDSYREILPNQFSTDLCCHFGLLPGKRVADIQRALVGHFLNKNIQDTATTEDILAFIEQRGLNSLGEDPMKNVLPGVVSVSLTTEPS